MARQPKVIPIGWFRSFFVGGAICSGMARQAHFSPLVGLVGPLLGCQAIPGPRPGTSFLEGEASDQGPKRGVATWCPVGGRKSTCFDGRATLVPRGRLPK